MSAWHMAALPRLDGSRAAEVKNKKQRLHVNLRQRPERLKPVLSFHNTETDDNSYSHT